MPAYFHNLLEVYGMRNLDDLETLDSALLDELTLWVRNDGAADKLDLGERDTKMKYFGHDVRDFAKYQIPPMDYKKALKIADAAKELKSAADDPNQEAIQPDKALKRSR